MIVLKPQTVNSTILTHSDIAEPDATYDYGATLWTAGTYATGVYKYKTTTHKIYQVVATPSTADDPEVGITKSPPTWVEIASTNRYRMFNGVINEITQSASNFYVEFTPGQIVNGIAAVNLVNVESIRVRYYDSVPSIIYDQTFSMFDNSAVVDWYEFFFLPIDRKTTFVNLSVPGGYPENIIRIDFTGTNIGVGEFIIGTQVEIGIANYGSSFEYLDFSRKERDQFGVYTIVPRNTSQATSFDITIEQNKISYVKAQIAEFTGSKTTPVVWVGTGESDDVTLTYGYCERYIQNIDTPTLCKATIEVQGLI